MALVWSLDTSIVKQGHLKNRKVIYAEVNNIYRIRYYRGQSAIHYNGTVSSMLEGMIMDLPISLDTIEVLASELDV